MRFTISMSEKDYMRLVREAKAWGMSLNEHCVRRLVHLHDEKPKNREKVRLNGRLV